ncbi:metallophosphoesterase [Bacillus taeanensis]|uniref:Metallophosphoesterase n=1 Tax=Bacillus taeanensis TaxID=273032 RepID=A0A366Y4A1_9BACI|nr:metallophosphoesterase [Bacillus taeanensis]RBW71243.1 metallophosphoesterase [Bacillus taeanensis]
MNEEKVSRRTFLKRSLYTIMSTIFAGSFGYYYARHIETKWLTINNLELRSPKIPSAFDGFTIVQFSDIHLGHNYTLTQFQGLVEEINSLKPDLILFTGDLIDSPQDYKPLRKISSILGQLSAPLGKFSIYGNHDHGGYGTETYRKIMEHADFKLLMNETSTIEKSGERLILAGIDDAMLGRPDLHQTLSSLSVEDYVIVMAHEPDIADNVARYAVDVQLSGHSHGGQVQLPFIGPLVTPPLAKKYYDGMYSVGESAMQLYVNRGIGTTREPYRFLCVPELTVFTLKNE